MISASIPGRLPFRRYLHLFLLVDWYRQRWRIEQMFRLLKQQGLNLEDSPVTTADGLMKLVAPSPSGLRS